MNEFEQRLRDSLIRHFAKDVTDNFMNKLSHAGYANKNDLARIISHSQDALGLAVLLIALNVFSEAELDIYLVAVGLFELPALSSQVEQKPEVDTFCKKVISFTNELRQVFLIGGKLQTYPYLVFIENLRNSKLFSFEEIFAGCRNNEQFYSRLRDLGLFKNLNFDHLSLSDQIWQLNSVSPNRTGTFFSGNTANASSFESKLKKFKEDLISNFKSSSPLNFKLLDLLSFGFAAMDLDTSGLALNFYSLIAAPPLCITSIPILLWRVDNAKISDSDKLFSWIFESTDFSRLHRNNETILEISKVLYAIYQVAKEYSPTTQLRSHWG